ncbi:enoyl-CoA hydratase-related protein [Streptomyces sp. NPDC020965]|uniref:enoyl-CoA hydratase-related protein n=1 Tax=Streptomyces sp. NPDC020965 TaxID=3365105 RepID=UPI0037B31375
MTGAAVDPRIEVAREGALVRISMQGGGQHNQLDSSSCAALADAFATAVDDPATRVVLLKGTPTFFCSGAAPELMQGDGRDRADQWGRLLLAVLDCPLPTVAAAQGCALGGGLLLALSCDVKVLSQSSRYAANFLVHGFTPIGGSLVPAAMGSTLGSEMLYTGRTFRGRELAERGAGVQVVPHEDVDREANRNAARIAQAPRRSLELMKQQLSSGTRDKVKSALAGEIAAHLESSLSAESLRRVGMLH